METLLSLKNQSEDFAVEFDILPTIDVGGLQNGYLQKIDREIFTLDGQLAENQRRIDELNAEIDRLTNHADGMDYTVAVACGILAGVIDSFFVGEYDKEWGNNAVNKFVIDNAKKKKIEEKVNQAIENAKKKGKTLSEEKIKEITEKVAKEFEDNGENTDKVLKKAIKFFEDRYKLPGDNVFQTGGRGISPSSHHLDDLAHHPTILGLLCSIIMQFTKYGVYQNKQGTIKFFPVEGDLVGSTIQQKLFAGTVNWFWHLVSDVAGSNKTAGAGMGIPGPIMSIAKEIAMLPGINKTPLPKLLGKLFEEKRIDFRCELTIGHELGKQAIPVLTNEVMVRSFYFIRHTVVELKIHHNFNEICWENTMPFKNRTIVRMMTVASGTFTAVDLADAAARSAIRSGGVNAPAFAANMILRVNFVGVGRFAIAIGTDVAMGVKRAVKRNERIRIYEEQIALTDAKMFYKQADMWIAAENTGETIERAYQMIETSAVFWAGSIQEISNDLERIGEYVPEIRDKDPGLLEEIDDILTWG